MKKITAFFLVLLPIFITGLMFISGLIQNINFPVSVAGISINEPDQDVKWEKDEQTKQQTCQFTAHVLPLNAKNKNIIWTSSDESIATVDNDGKVTVKDYGRVMITATAEGNTSCVASREVDSFDTIVHEVDVANKYEVSYLTPGSITKTNLITKPTIDHAEKVDSIEYKLESESEKIKIDEKTGIIQVEADATDVSAKVTAKVKTSKEDGNKTLEVETQEPITIKVGQPLDVLTFKDSTDLTISSNQYELFKDLVSAPAEIGEGKDITAKDFTFASENPDIATIENYDSKKPENVPGRITFKRPNEFATFTVTYNRNPDVRAIKRVQTTNGELKEVYFSQTSIELPYDGQREFTKEELTYTTYPKDVDPRYMSFVDIESTNTNVVDVVKPLGGEPVPFIVGPGQCALKISVGADENKTKSDICLVNITMPENESINWFKQDKVTLNNTYYYPIKNNLIVASTSINPQDFNWYISKDPNGVAYIDNDIVHFKKPGTITITDRNSSKHFDIECPDSKVQPEIKDNTLLVEVGQRINLTDKQAVFTDKYYRDYFDINDDDKTFIPKRGCNINDFEIIVNGTKLNINLIVKEDPICITADESAAYSTSEESIDFLNTFNPQIYPKTATKSSGAMYEAIYDYDFGSDTSIGTIDENVINFAKIGTCTATVNFGYIDEDETKAKISLPYFVRSTCGDQIGKFVVNDGEELLPFRRHAMQQYEEWKIDEKPTLHIFNVSHRTYGGLQIKSLNGLCNPTLDWSGLLLTGHVVLKANPIYGAWGTDIIEVSSPTYSLFLTVNLSPAISDFVVTYKNDVWDENAINSYIGDLKGVRITPNTIGVDKETEWSWQLNEDDPVTLKGTKTIDLKGLVSGSNTLKLSSGGKEIKHFEINYKTSEQPVVSLYESEDGIYASCNENSKSALIVTDGYVDESAFYQKYKNSTLSNADKEKLTFNDIGNILTISNIDTKDSDLKFNLKESESKTIKTYPVGKDTISKIKLPDNNILDQSDKKGMQKVHVYGNYSWYNQTDPNMPGYGTEGEVDYYKVRVVLYNAARQAYPFGEETKGTKLKELRNLKISIGRNSHYEIKDEDNGDYIRVYFHKNDLYSKKEIYDNAFDTKSGKNIDFKVSTKSNEVYAQYKFVAVEGTNVWTQEPLVKLSEYQLKANAAVLQTNFGLSKQQEKYSTPLDRTDILDLYAMYGNGYCYDMKYLSIANIAIGMWTNPSILFASNVDINGRDSETLLSRNQKTFISFNDGKTKLPDERMVCYTMIHHCDEAIHADNNTVDSYIKNSIFYNVLNSCILTNAMDKDPFNLYLENLTFFNSASFPITLLGPTPIYFKGDINVYNFQDKEMLRHVGGEVDLTDLWPVVLQFARNSNMIHRDYKNDEVINSFMCCALTPRMYFWDSATQQYVSGERGRPGAAQFIAKYADISIPFPGIGRVGANLWGGVKASRESGAPEYSEEFDSEGKLKTTFISTQIDKWTRHPRYF